MAHIDILVGNIQPSETSGNLVASGIAVMSTAVEGERQVNFSAEYAQSAGTLAKNTAIRDAAIAAAENAGFTIGGLDNKTSYAGAQGL